MKYLRFTCAACGEIVRVEFSGLVRAHPEDVKSPLMQELLKLLRELHHEYGPCIPKEAITQ